MDTQINSPFVFKYIDTVIGKIQIGMCVAYDDHVLIGVIV